MAEPWIKLKVGFRRSGKIAALPSDSARLGWTYALLEAKTQRRMGVFDSRSHFVEVLGRFGKFFEAYVAQDLLEIAPQLCRECKPRNAGVRRGEVVIHDYQKEQRDPSNADRQASYRENHRDGDEPSGTPDVTPTVTAPVTAPVTPTVTEEVTPTHAGGRERRPAQASGRAATVTETVTTTVEGTPTSDLHARNGKVTRSTRGPTRVGDIAADLAERSEDWTQALTLAERDEWSSFGPEWDAFKAAWLAHGFRHPPAGNADDDPDAPNPSQRALLWSVLDAWPNELARWIAETPKKLSASQVVAHVIDRWHGKRDEATERVERQAVATAAARVAEATPPADPRVKTWVDQL